MRRQLSCLTGMFDLTMIFHGLQRQLFPELAAELGPLSALDQQFCEVISLTQLGRFTQEYEWCGEGRPPCSRTWLAHAFIAKSAYQFPTTGALIDALLTRPTPVATLRRGKTALGAGASPTIQGTQRERTRQQPLEGTVWRVLGARARRGQGDMPFDVRAGGPDSDRALCAPVLKATNRAARGGGP